MKFKIDFDIPARELLTDFDPVFLMGSCFAEHQAQQFSSWGFPTRHNPFGILYNPWSMAQIMERLAQDKGYSPEDFMEHDGLYFHLGHHGSCKYPSIKEAVRIFQQAAAANQGIHPESAHLIILTFGTSLIHEHEDFKGPVANNHKLPQAKFTVRQMGLIEVDESIQRILDSIRMLNPDAQVVVTLSPVRHLRSGVVESQMSKSLLRTALGQLKGEAYYFPAYEIFLDELRDYRFADTDLAHPNAQAEHTYGSVLSKPYFPLS